MKTQNKLFKFLAFILSFAILLAMISINVFAYSTNVDITDIVAPESGEAPCYTATVEGTDFEIFDDTFDYVIGGITWYDLTENSNITNEDTFIKNHAYRVSVLIIPADDGYWSLQTATINGEEADVNEADDFYIVSYVFGEEPVNPDETANITITTPVGGQLPSYNATIDNECFEIYEETDGYIYNGVAWFDLTACSNIDNCDEFINGHSYSVTILIKKAEGVEIDLLYATINGYEAELGSTEDDYGNFYYLVSYDFGEKPIDPDETINITIDEPVAGKKPTYTASIDNECFELKEENSGYIYNGITWFDETFGSNVHKDNVFLEAHTYTVAFLVVKGEGVELELLHANVNGNVAEFYETDEYYYVYYQYYIETEKQVITSVNIYHLSEPSPAYGFDYIVTLGGVGYKTKNTNNSTTINGISWYDCTEEKFVETTDVCISGHDYAAIFELEAEDGYILLPETVNINGESVGFSYYGEDVHAEAYFEYVDPYIRAIELNDVQIPVQGDAPDYSVTTDSAKYTFENKNDAYFSNGVAWFDLSEGKYLEKDLDSFVGGHSYMIEIYLVPEYGFSFDLTSVTLNGEKVTDVWGGVGTRVVLYYTFDFCESPTDITIFITAEDEHSYTSPNIELIDPETDEVVYAGIAHYSYDNSCYIGDFYNVYPTNYIMRVSTDGFATRNYSIKVSSFDNKFDVELCKNGDVNMDGIVDVNDYQAAVNIALTSSKVPTDTSQNANYIIALADYVSDGFVDVIDCSYLERET